MVEWMRPQLTRFEGARQSQSERDRAGDALLVEATDRGFRMRASGFDINRDLEVRCHRLRKDAV